MFPLLAHDYVLDLISVIGIKGVDVGLFEGRSHLQPSVEFRNTSSSARTLKQKLDACNLLASDIYLDTGNNFEEEAINYPDQKMRCKTRELFRHALEWKGCNEVDNLSETIA